jgi:lathosterol oxidase
VLLVLNVLTVPIFVAQVRGLARIYAFGTGSTGYEAAEYPLFVLFSDACMYWMHRALHHSVLFKVAHYKHHR